MLLSFTLLLAGCAEAPPPPTEGPAPAVPAAAPPASTPAVSLDCPEGTTLEENRRDDGLERWCDRGGVQHGPYVRYYPDGSRAVQGAWDNNQEDGTWVWWHPDGQESARGRYIRGRQTGSWSWWYANGNRNREGDYLQGREAGLWMSWYENGRRHTEGLYHNGMKNGTWTTYADSEENGVERTEQWANGVAVSTNVVAAPAASAETPRSK